MREPLRNVGREERNESQIRFAFFLSLAAFILGIFELALLLWLPKVYNPTPPLLFSLEIALGLIGLALFERKTLKPILV